MPRLRAWFSRLLGLFQKNKRDAEMAEEMQAHLDLLIERNIAAGMLPHEARNAALRQFGGVEQTKEIAREQRVWRWADEFLQDLRFGARMLFRNPGFSILAILCLTLGIGTNAAALSWIEGILIRPYPLVAHQDRMFAFIGTTRGVEGHNGLSYPDFLDFEKNSTLFESFIVDRIMGTSLSVGDRAEWASGGIVSANYFDALGVRPILGRGFRPEEGTGRNAHPVTVISYRTWKDRYDFDPNIIGRTQYLNGVQHTIIGVAPEKFHGTFVGYSFSFWVPTSMQETFDTTGYKLEDRGARWIEGYAFLKPGVTRQQGQAELNSIAQRLEHDFPETNRGHEVQLVPLWKTPFNGAGNMSPTLAITMAVVFLVLLIACANVSNLLLARSLLRRHEMTMRLALGAGRRRLIKQLVTEGLLLSIIAAAGGIAVAYWCRNALVLAFPSPVPGVVIDFPGQIDWRVLLVSAGICILSTLVFALVPAIHASHVDLSGALKSDGGGVVSGSSRSRLRSTLVLVQVSLSFVLLAGTGLLLESLAKIRNANPGFSTDAIACPISLFSAGYKLDRAKAFQTELLDRVRTLPGVESATFARVIPFSYNVFSSSAIEVDGYQPPPNQQPTLDYVQVAEDYFATLGIPIVSGREFTRTDDENAPPIAIINETMAAKYWPGKNAVGQRVKVTDRWLEIVGIAKNSNYRTKLEPTMPFLYVPLRQNWGVQNTLLVRTRETPGALLNALSREVHALDANLAPRMPSRMQEQVDEMSYSQRLAVTLVAVFGTMALFLAAIGLYAVMSYSVSQGTRELGLRMALGADAGSVLRLVLSRGLRLTTAGIALGAIAALVLTRLMGNLLYQVSPRDPIAYGFALLVLLGVALLACFLPARRATRVDPVSALRV
ncbi:MAG TPA: ABC transporter permease [Chthoniobacterales bacterium]|jgi:macrolide transport system ATP-binding/permease protein|nr:ABC transporter permease [Chthoniobacterales bacterium]